MATILDICQEAAGRLGLEELTSVMSSTNRTARRLRRLANSSGVLLAARAEWQVLKKEQTFLTVAADEQTNGDLPAGYDHMIPKSAFNRSRTRPLAGPLTSAEWQQRKSLASNLGPTDSIYIRGGAILMTPTPNAGDTIAYEYISTYWVDTDADGVGDAALFTVDADNSLLDREMSVLDLMWRYKESRGLPYAETFRSAELRIADRIAKDGIGKRDMRLAKTNYGQKPRPPVIPEGSWSVS